MSKVKFNIEDKFLAFNPQDFPDERDYVAKYRALREIMNNQIHSEIKSIALRFLPEAYLNDHGEKHIKKVIEKASEIICGYENHLSPYEIFFLLMSIQIHDAGHIIKGREEHARNAELVIKRVGVNILSAVERTYIFKIACAHSGKDDPIGALEDNQVVSGFPVNLKLIAAIVRLADELADDTTRASSFLLDQNLIEEKSRIFHVFSQCLDSSVFDSNHIRLFFYLDERHLTEKFSLREKNVFLLNEIYERTIKTFTESIYCNRFLPEAFKVRSVSVRIIIDSEDSDVEPKEINFRLAETGYPSKPFSDIFDFCETLKTENGKKITGEYYNDLITKKDDQN